MLINPKLAILTLGLMICTSPALAQEAQESAPPQEALVMQQAGPVKIQIIQPYASKTLGGLTLPFGWQAEEIELQKRVIAMETLTNTPAILTIDLIEPPKGIEDAKLVQAIADSMAETMGTTAEIKPETIKTQCGKSKCPSLTIYRSSFRGIEKNVGRRCAIEVVPTPGKALVFSICAVATQTYEPDLPEILNQVFAEMK